jgi:hypothetical protein
MVAAAEIESAKLFRALIFETSVSKPVAPRCHEKFILRHDSSVHLSFIDALF